MASKLIRIPKGIKNSMWSVLDAAIYPAVYMAMVPMLMKGLGTVAFGVWIVLNTLMTTLQLFNLNISLTTVKKLSSHAARQDQEKLNLELSAILRITLFLLIFVTALGWIITMIVPVWNFLGISADASGNLTACILLAAFITGLKFIDQVFQGVLKAFELFRPAAILNLINRIGLLLVTVALALAHVNVEQLFVANAVFTLAYLLVHWIVIKRSLPMLHISLVEGKKLKRSVLSFSKWPWLQSIIVIITFQTDRFWVSSFAGLKEVSAYGLVATMFNHIHMIFIAVAAWIFPRISGMVARGDDPEPIYRSVRGLLLTIVTVSLLLFYYASPLLFGIWVGKDMYAGMAPYIKAFTGFELLFAQTIMPFFYLNASGKERLATGTTLFYSTACYLTMIAGLILFHHSEYMIHGMTLSLCFTMPVLNILVNKYISKRSALKESMLEALLIYLALALIYMPQFWLKALLLPAILLMLFQNYLLPLFQQRLWKQQVKL